MKAKPKAERIADSFAAVDDNATLVQCIILARQSGRMRVTHLTCLPCRPPARAAPTRFTPPSPSYVPSVFGACFQTCIALPTTMSTLYVLLSNCCCWLHRSCCLSRAHNNHTRIVLVWRWAQTFDENPDDTQDRVLAGHPVPPAEVQQERLTHALVRCPANASSDSLLGWLLLPDTADEKVASACEVWRMRWLGLTLGCCLLCVCRIPSMVKMRFPCASCASTHSRCKRYAGRQLPPGRSAYACRSCGTSLTLPARTAHLSQCDRAMKMKKSRLCWCGMTMSMQCMWLLLCTAPVAR